ncbi:MAG: DUF4143 domain-containing protein [Candidatus Ancillula sp.]|jgi:predicted AAA+ superfamily ATPase|nr:DUF4143 domain-containing protein [Candidatus Ancillula sp.]
MYEIPRHLTSALCNNTESYFGSERVVHISGPNCSGKTHIMQKYLETIDDELVLRVDGNDITSRILIMSNDSTALFDWSRGKRVIFIDNAQRIQRLDRSLKILTSKEAQDAGVDPNIQILLTYSTRSIEDKHQIRVYPVAISELRLLYRSTPVNDLLQDILIYGALPEVLSSPSIPEKRDMLIKIVNTEMLKDVFELERIANSKSMMELLYYIALHINKSTSLNMIANKVGINPRTAERYIKILEKHYIIHEHKAYKNRLTNEISKFSRFYFYDIGIRNALINNFNDSKRRNDMDSLWANFLIIERHKAQELKGISHANDVESYFWETWSSKDIDLIETGLGEKTDYGLHAYRFYYDPDSGKYSVNPPKVFAQAYFDASFEVITPSNFEEFIHADFKI